MACADLQRIDGHFDNLLKAQEFQQSCVNSDMEVLTFYVKYESEIVASIAELFRAYKAKMQILEKYNYSSDDTHEKLYSIILDKKKRSAYYRDAILSNMKNQQTDRLYMMDRLKTRKKLSSKSMFSPEPSCLDMVSK